MEEYSYTNDQIVSLFAKLETAKELIRLGTEMAKQAETDLRFYRMTNPLFGEVEDGENG